MLSELLEAMLLALKVLWAAAHRRRATPSATASVADTRRGSVGCGVIGHYFMGTQASEAAGQPKPWTLDPEP